MTAYHCPRAVFGFMYCYAFCSSCRAESQRRVRAMPEPTVHDDRDPPDQDDALYDHRDKDPDWGRSER